MEEKKRKWNKYSGAQKKTKQVTLESGMTGFLCTCNFREKECIRDAYRLLEEYSGDQIDDKTDKKEVSGDHELLSTNTEPEGKNVEDEEDIADALNREIKELSDQAKKPVDQRKFQYIDTGGKNVIFIRTTLPDPLELATKIIHDLDKTKKSRSRYLLRLIPIQIICKANMNDIKAKSSDLFEKYFAQEPKTFAIVVNRHYNNTIQRNDVIEVLAALVSEKNPGNRADLKNPEIAVVAEIIKGNCLISIAPDYFKYKKYNLLELCNVKEESAEAEKPQDAKENKEAGDKESSSQEKVEQGENAEVEKDAESEADSSVEEKIDKDVDTSPEK